MGEDEASFNLLSSGAYGSGELNPWTVNRRREARVNFILVIVVAPMAAKLILNTYNENLRTKNGGSTMHAVVVMDRMER